MNIEFPKLDDWPAYKTALDAFESARKLHSDTQAIRLKAEKGLALTLSEGSVEAELTKQLAANGIVGPQAEQIRSNRMAERRTKRVLTLAKGELDQVTFVVTKELSERVQATIIGPATKSAIAALVSAVGSVAAAQNIATAARENGFTIPALPLPSAIGLDVSKPTGFTKTILEWIAAGQIAKADAAAVIPGI